MGPGARRIAVAALAIAGLSACTGGSPKPSPSAATTVSAEVASADLYTGAAQDVEVGVFQSDDQGVKVLTFGTVQFRFSDLGGGGTPVPGPAVTADYVAAPTTAEGGGSPQLSTPGDARGVYVASGVTFDRAGSWQVDVVAEIPGMGTVTMPAAFAVHDTPQLPAPGQPALKTHNLTVHSKGVSPIAVDSRAGESGPIPDPELHEWTIAGAIARHKAALVLFATPVYCLSQFCGPDVDALAGIARDYGNKAVFIHVEIWKDFQNTVANKAAADWLFRNDDLTEPWLYLIGRDGTILDRWGPLWDPAAVRAELDRAIA
jgi:hypothetical protein